MNGDVLHHRHGGKNVADLAGQVGMTIDVLLESRPLALAIALEKLLGELHHNLGSRF